jgi:hypothetical protein
MALRRSHLSCDKALAADGDTLSLEEQTATTLQEASIALAVCPTAL